MNDSNHPLTASFRLLPILTRHRFVVGQLAWRAFAARHAGSYLGWLWTPLATVVQFALYMVVFSAILQIKVEGLGIDLARRPAVGFGAFLITGLVPFLAFNDAVTRAARVFHSNASLVQRVRLPAEVLVLGDVAGTLLHHAISLAVVILYCVWRGHLSIAGAPWLALGLAAAVVWIVGAALLASVLGAFLPDIAEAIGLGLQVMFYGAPIVYPLALVRPELVRTVVELNPLTPLVGVMRSGLLGANAPALTSVVYLVIGGVVLLVVGSAVLDRWRKSIPDLV